MICLCVLLLGSFHHLITILAIGIRYFCKITCRSLIESKVAPVNTKIINLDALDHHKYNGRINGEKGNQATARCSYLKKDND